MRGDERRMIFTVLGLSPAPQGSKRHVGGGRMVESSAKVRPWREAVRQEAIATGLAISAEPIYLHLLFRFRRPKGHYDSKGQIRASARIEHITRPDLDKLCRSTLDALTGVLFADDSQVAFLVASKEYCLAGELEGCQIEIREIKG
jgi:crossover junction endodeoxyribonuclease RusA